MDIDSNEFQIGLMLGIKLGKVNTTIPDLTILETFNKNLSNIKYKDINCIEDFKLLTDNNMAYSQE